MSLDIVKNLAVGNVSTGYNSAAVTIALHAGDGNNFPSTFPFQLIWWNVTDYANPALDPYIEIIRVTNRVGDVLTILRAQEETVANNHNLVARTYRVALVLTAKMITDINAVLDAARSPIDKNYAVSAFSNFSSPTTVYTKNIAANLLANNDSVNFRVSLTWVQAATGGTLRLKIGSITIADYTLVGLTQSIILEGMIGRRDVSTGTCYFRQSFSDPVSDLDATVANVSFALDWTIINAFQVILIGGAADTANVDGVLLEKV